MFHRILFIINRKFLSRFLMDFQVQESEFSCFLSPFFFLSIHLWKKNRSLHEEESILCLWRADWPAYLVHSQLKTRPLHAEMDCRVYVSHPLSEGMTSLEMEEERIEQSPFLFFSRSCLVPMLTTQGFPSIDTNP